MQMGVTPSQWLEFDSLDRSLIITHLRNESLKCPGCGAYMDESTKTDHVYRVHEMRCNECNALHKHSERNKQRKPGTYFHAEPVPLDQLKR